MAMKISKSRAAFAAAMLVGMSVLAACGSDKDTAENAPSAVQPSIAPSTPWTPSASPTQAASPSGSPSASADAEFLAAADWPTGSRYGTWNAQGEKDGLRDPEHFCIKGVLPTADTEYQSYGSDLEAEGTQFVVDTGSEEDATALATKLNAALDGCVAAYDEEFPGEDTSATKYADLDLGGGVKQSGFFFAPKDSEYHMQLVAVGRVGQTVTVIVLGQGGKADEAPKDAFAATVAKAMEKLEG
ncbi:MAG: hypothetical protein ACT4QG_21165 [Sporichthyaceae bacterium]